MYDRSATRDGGSTCEYSLGRLDGVSSTELGFTIECKAATKPAKHMAES